MVGGISSASSRELNKCTRTQYDALKSEFTSVLDRVHKGEY